MEVIVTIAGLVFAHAIYSIAKDYPLAMERLCTKGKSKCFTCYDKFRCWTNRC